MDKKRNGQKDKAMKKILFIIGSLRKESFNRQLAAIAEKMIDGRATVEYLDYSNLPMMNQDVEFPAPEAVSSIRKKIEEADGLWIFTPEYNYSYPAVLKNLIDWLSRPLKAGDRSTAVIAGKSVTVSSAAGGSAGAGARAMIGKLMAAVQANYMEEPQTGVRLDRAAFTTDVLTLSEEDRAALAAQADAFLAF